MTYSFYISKTITNDTISRDRVILKDAGSKFENVPSRRNVCFCSSATS
jgi:hypothetical protein